MLIHATAVVRSGACVLLTGPSGAGKSDLALRLIAWPPSGLALPAFVLLADDQVDLAAVAQRVVARTPPTIAGRIEVRGAGIVMVPRAEAAPVALVVELTRDHASIDRYPAPSTAIIAGVALPSIRLHAFEPSAPLKVHLALDAVLAMGGEA